MYSSTFITLLAATWIPSTLGCIWFNATLHEGANVAKSAQEATAINDAKKTGAQLGDQRLDVYFWDDADNDDIVEPLKDAFCTGVDLKPYADNTWVVPCTPEEKQVELDIVYNPDITEGGVLINIFKYNNPRVMAKNFNDKDKDLIYTFNTESKDAKGTYFEDKIFCNNCKGTAGQPVKC